MSVCGSGQVGTVCKGKAVEASQCGVSFEMASQSKSRQNCKGVCESTGRGGQTNGGVEMVYEWTDNRHKVSAQVAGEICATLEEEGMLTAKNLVDVSRPEDAPLHEEFDWDNEVAGEKWREHQARNVINSIRVVKVNEGDTNGVRAFFHLKMAEPEYESIQVIVKDENKYTKLLKIAISELNHFEKKYASIKEFSKIFEELHRIEQNVA